MDIPGKLVEVTWVDSAGNQGWHDPRDSARMFESMVIHSVGYLIEDSDRGIGLIMGYGNDLHLDSLLIPRVAVLHTEELGYHS